jgi:GNAT superfamily N-acetyltransferase
MVQWWRLTRNDYGRAVFDFLADHGLKVARMYGYVADLDSDPPRDSSLDDPALELRVVDASAVEAEEHAAFGELLPGERVVVAVDTSACVETEPTGRETARSFAAGPVVGYLFVSAGQPVFVHPLETELRFDGAYVRRVFVEPDARQRGIATALVAESRRVARETFDASEAHALIAPDNRPSQWVFEANGFRRVHEYDYARVGDWTRRRDRPLPASE